MLLDENLSQAPTPTEEFIPGHLYSLVPSGVSVYMCVRTVIGGHSTYSLCHIATGEPWISQDPGSKHPANHNEMWYDVTKYFVVKRK